MEDSIHKSGVIEPWRFVSYRGRAEREEPDAAESRSAGSAAAVLRRALDILKRFPEALEAVQAGMLEAPA